MKRRSIVVLVLLLSAIATAGLLWGAQIVGYLDLSLMAAPGNPNTGFLRLYADTLSNTVLCKTPAGAACNIGTGVTAFSGDGALISNSGSTGAVTVTLGNAGAHQWWGNNTGSTAAPGYQSIGLADLPAITSAALNITSSTCSGPQVLTAISSGGVGTCSSIPIPQNSQSAAYTTVLGDAEKQIYHPSADTTARTWTIDSNANVAFPVGTTITFLNDCSAGTITIAITADTLVLAGTGTTGSRTLAACGLATALKIGTTRWIINGVGLT